MMKRQKPSDEEIERLAQSDPDALPLPDHMMRGNKKMTFEEFMKERKKPVTIRLDPEVLEWFKKQGKGYQSRINAALKAFIAHQG